MGKSVEYPEPEYRLDMEKSKLDVPNGTKSDSKQRESEYGMMHLANQQIDRESPESLETQELFVGTNQNLEGLKNEIFSKDYPTGTLAFGELPQEPVEYNT